MHGCGNGFTVHWNAAVMETVSQDYCGYSTAVHLSVWVENRDFLGCVIFMLFVCSVDWLFLLGCQYQCKRLTGKTRLQNDN